MRLTCHLTQVPDPGGRVLVRLTVDADVATLEEVETLSEATHQVVSAQGHPFLTHLVEKDQIVSAEVECTDCWPSHSCWPLGAINPHH